MAATLEARHAFPVGAPSLTVDDFETASIRSAAPSYISEAPSYHSTAPYVESIPPYTPPGTTTTSHSTNTRQPLGSPSTSMLPESSGSRHRTIGLPPIPPPGSAPPQLNSFIIPTWSVVRSNPTYQNVARRRAQSDADPIASMRRAFFLERVAEHDDDSSPPSSSPGSRHGTPTPAGATRRPLEDPHLVGDEAAAQARRTRLARERGQVSLVQEDRQWDWFLGTQLAPHTFASPRPDIGRRGTGAGRLSAPRTGRAANNASPGGSSRGGSSRLRRALARVM